MVIECSVRKSSRDAIAHAIFWVCGNGGKRSSITSPPRTNPQGRAARNDPDKDEPAKDESTKDGSTNEESAREKSVMDLCVIPEPARQDTSPRSSHQGLG